MCVTESLGCTPETNTLEINYISIQIKKRDEQTIDYPNPVQKTTP